MKTFNFIVSTPDGKIFEDKVCSVRLRAAEGDVTILAGHISFITPVVSCRCVLKLSDGIKKIGKTRGGMLSVEKERTVLLSNVFEFE